MTADRILAALVDGGPIPGRHLLVTAHPDDETISAAGLLCRVTDARIVQLTTGSDDRHAAVTTLRRRERDAACAAAGWPWPILDAGVPGRAAHQHLAALLAVVETALVEVDVVWTHPYEGGHLDHETAAWLVQTAGARTGTLRMEFASYHATPMRQTFGDFWPDPRVRAVHVPLDAATWGRKRAALDAYASQASILRKFPTPGIEAYRAAPVYDFTRRPPPPRCRWDVKKYAPSTATWRETIAAATLAIRRAG